MAANDMTIVHDTLKSHHVHGLPHFTLRRAGTETLAQAIDRQFTLLCQGWESEHAMIGNVAGWTLHSVHLEPPQRQTTRGGKTFATLVIKAYGRQLAGRHPTDPGLHETRIDIEATVDDVPERFDFEIRG